MLNEAGPADVILQLFQMAAYKNIFGIIPDNLPVGFGQGVVCCFCWPVDHVVTRWGGFVALLDVVPVLDNVIPFEPKYLEPYI